MQCGARTGRQLQLPVRGGIDIGPRAHADRQRRPARVVQPQLQAVAAAIRPYGSGFMTIYSSKGMVLGAGDKALVGKADPGLPAAARRAIRSGASLQYVDDAQVLHYIEPMRVGNIRNAWAVRISIPLDSALADRTTRQITQSVQAAQAIPAPFDQAIQGARDSASRAKIQATIDSLVQQSKDLVEAANAVGITQLNLVDPKAN